MINTKFKNFTSAYVASIKDVLESGSDIESVKDESSVTYGKSSRELLGYNFSVDNVKTRIIEIPERKFNLTSSIGFFLWILRGSNVLKEINYYNSFAEKLSDDGQTHRGAYGYRLGLFNKNEIKHTHLSNLGTHNQVECIIKRLKEDGNSRRAFLSVYDPKSDSYPEATRDYPCTIGYHLLIRDGHLDMTCMMRSQSVVMVMPYDIFNNTMLQEYIATRLKVPAGKYIHLASSFHILDSELEFAKKIEKQYNWENPSMPRNFAPAVNQMPPMTVEGCRSRDAWNWLQVKERLIRESGEKGGYITFNKHEKLKYGNYMRDMVTFLQLYTLNKLMPDDDYNRGLLVETLDPVYRDLL